MLRTKPIIGYLHTGMEKTGEDLTYLQGRTNVTRMDYASPLFNELVFSMATEKLLGIEATSRPGPTWIRMLMCELNRHLVAPAVPGHQRHGPRRGGMMIYGWREREEVLRFLEKVTGLRMNHNYIRPGGVAADLPDGWRDDVLRILDVAPRPADEYDTLMTGQPIWRERLQGVGVITAQEAIALGATGPILRSHRRARGTSAASSPTSYYDRGRVRRRRRHLRRHVRPVRHPPQRGPRVDAHRAPDPRPDARPATTASRTRRSPRRPRARIDESMEALIHHFKIFTEGFKVPEGEVYVAIESPRGELGCYIVSDGSGKPYRMHIRGPSFVNLQTLPHMMRGGLIADAVAVISSVDPIMGEVDQVAIAMARRFTASEQRGVDSRWPTRSSRATRVPEVGADPAVPPRPGAGRLAHRRRHGPHRRAGRGHAGRGARHGQLLRDVQAPPRRALPGEHLHEHRLLPHGRRRAARTTPRSGSASGPAARRPTACSPSRSYECIAACTEAPCLQVNYRYFYKVTPRRLRRARRRPAPSTARPRHPAARHAGPGAPAARPRPPGGQRRPEGPHPAGVDRQRPSRARRRRTDRRRCRPAGEGPADDPRRPADHHRPLRARRLAHPRALPGHRRLRGPAGRAADRPPAGGRPGQGGQPARPGRRRFPRRGEVGLPARRASTRTTSWSTATRASRERTRTAC